MVAARDQSQRGRVTLRQQIAYLREAATHPTLVSQDVAHTLVPFLVSVERMLDAQPVGEPDSTSAETSGSAEHEPSAGPGDR
jgi:hypothetical protein